MKNEFDDMDLTLEDLKELKGAVSTALASVRETSTLSSVTFDWRREGEQILANINTAIDDRFFAWKKRVQQWVQEYQPEVYWLPMSDQILFGLFYDGKVDEQTVAVKALEWSELGLEDRRQR